MNQEFNIQLNYGYLMTE